MKNKRSRIIPRNLRNNGYIMPAVLSFIIACGLLGSALLMIIMQNFFVVGRNINSQQAFNLAEAGVNYYLWHMAHNGTDYRDGRSTPATPDATLGYGPYVHTYRDADAKTAGTFTLWIKPQGSGSTITTVRSIGKTTNNTATRTVEAKLGITSFASYALVSDLEFWFGASEAANGPVFSNVGIHMDGPNSDVVAAANARYTPGSSYSGGVNGQQNGVWCNTSVLSPNCTTRDKSNWLYPMPSVDFNLVSSSLCTMKKVALANHSSTAAIATAANACTQTPTTRTTAYIPRYSTSGFSTDQGYLIELNSNGSYNLYRISAENDKATTHTAALTKTSVATNIVAPSSGVIFVEDNVWVRTNPNYHGRISVASGRLATSDSTNIKIADDLLYSVKNGSDSIGLIAENDILIAPYAPPSSGAFTFEIDAAALAQSGAVKWPRNYDGTNDCTRGWTAANQTFVFYGSVATRQNWTWNYLSGNCGDAVRDSASGNYVSGIMNTTTAYDYSLLYAPPPSYPVTGTYNILSWREVLAKP